MEHMDSKDLEQLRVNGDRLWQNLMELAQIGATAKGGVCRVALSNEDRIGREWFIERCKAAGCTIAIDQMGSIFARREGTDEEALPILFGSHLDSQPTGGKFDGAYGVLAALEVIETLNDHQVQTRAPLEIVSWTNEEGARFAPAMVASGVFGGEFTLEYGLSRADKEGKTIGQELERIGYAGEMPVTGRDYAASFEIHIEQGPILESEDISVGIVTGVQGMRWYHLTIEGKESHAGTTPMDRRRDPVRAVLPIIQEFYALADEYFPNIRMTIGDLIPSPGSINTVPGQLTLTFDIRHPDASILDTVEKALQDVVQEAYSASGQAIELKAIWNSPPVSFAQECIDAVRRATVITGIQPMEITSGAGHDAAYINRVVPTSMIFVPCEDGLSHNELENAKQSDLVDGCNVLLHAVLDRANYR
ncbi:MAG: Zn-dependent hydrolase [Chloroflexota bacterium]